jgi:S-DNA-T family DNA segregation ATPase FtsK/SpoIIIE
MRTKAVKTKTRSTDEINMWDALYRHRLAWGPFYVGVAAVIAASLSALLSTWQTVLVLVPVGLAWAAWAHTRIPDKMRRIYAYVVLVATLAWVLSAHELFPEAFDWLAITLLSGVLVLGIPWWTSDRKRTQVRIEEGLRDWPTVAKRIGRDLMKPVDVTLTPIGRKGKFVWPVGAYEVDSILRDKSRIEGAMGADRGTLRLEMDGRSTNSVRWQVIERDPHSAAQPWPLPTHLGRAEEPMVLGPREDGEMAKVQRFVPGVGVRNMLIAGQQGSGKSSLVNLEVATGAVAEDEFMIGFDFKEVELTPWKGVLGYMTASVEKARALVMAITEDEVGLLAVRQRKLAKRGARCWDTKIDGPIITLIIDEAKDLLGMGDSKLVDRFALIGTKGRALGVRFAMATQYPTLEAIGSSQIRQQIRHRFCFRMQDDTGEDFVMPGHKVRADRIPDDRPGTCYFLNSDKLESMPIRILYLDDATVAAVASARAGLTPELDPESEAALIELFPEWADRERYVPAGVDDETDGTDAESETGTDSETGTETDGTDSETEVGDMGEWDAAPDVDLADMIAARRRRMTEAERDAADRQREELLAEDAGPSKRLGEEEAKQAMLTKLAEAWPEGVKAKELQTAATRSASWFYPVANAWSEEGIVQRTKHGSWALVAPPPRAVKTDRAHSV